MHGLGAREHARPLLGEIWRVLAPDGRVIIIVPNRRGLWARFDRTPLGQGRPYSRGQLETLLQEAMFSNFEWETALYLPPFDKRWLLRWAGAFERVGRRLPATFGGIVLGEARKETMQALAVPAFTLAPPPLVPAHGVATKVSRRHAGSSVE